MWGARGARLWRTGLPKILHCQDAAAAKSSSQLQQHCASLLDSPHSLWSLASRSESAAVLASKDLCWRPAGSALLGLQQKMGIMTSSESLQAVDGGDQPVRSPLSQAPAPVDSAQAGSKPLMGIKKETQAVLTYIKQSPKKVNLVAELVRGMRVDDALMQMAVSTKRAAKVVTKVITSARANAIHNFGMDKDRLVVAEAFVGKDRYLKRLRIHGKGKAGKMVRPRCRLTVIVKELSAEREAELARIRVHKFHSKKIRGSIRKLMPHKVLATQWQWSRKPRKGSVSVE